MAYNFKDEADVRLFLKNLGIEYRFSCYHENRPDGCHLLGDYLESIDRDFQKAGTVYQSNCDKNNFARSCFKYGNYLLLGKGVKENKKLAYQYYKKGCEHECKDCCFHCGLMHTSDQDNTIEKDFKKGFEYFKKGCKLQDGECCFLVSNHYLFGNEHVEKDPVRAFEHAVQACNLNHIQACAHLSLMYQRGIGVQQDDEMAKKIKRKAMDLHDQHTKHQRTVEFGLGTE